MARPKNTETRRAEIVAAFRRVMATEGYEGATIAKIAREAGLAPGLVHYHFADKRSILLALVDDLVARSTRRIDARTAKSPSARARLDATVAALLARGHDEDLEAVACQTMLATEAVKSAEVRDVYREHVTALAERLRTTFLEAFHDEARSGEGAKAMSAALVALVQGYYALATAAPDAVPVGSAVAMAHRMIDGLFATQPRREETR